MSITFESEEPLKSVEPLESFQDRMEQNRAFASEPGPKNTSGRFDEAGHMKRSDEIPFQLTYRAVKEEDLHFILSSWLKSYRDSKRSHKNHDYFPGQQRLIGALGQRRHLVLAVDADAPEWIAGYACGQMMKDGSLLLDYVYVKHPYRERGIARGLITALGWSPGTQMIATHWNRTASHLATRFLATHNEYYLMIGSFDADL